ncbi:MAG: DNA topoisomerase IB [Bdellovibrionaceae bacterium]|nr:DNA topoisomerase IB [Pseudobdellovibrionaceae bacterium]
MKKSTLNFSNDKKPGWTRKKLGKKYVFCDLRGKRVVSAKITERLNKLAVPPAYRDVWYSPDPRGHIQAVGWDARGRKQYRYHQDWVAQRDEHKYERMIEFAKSLPQIRRLTNQHLKLRGLPREKVLATVVQLLEKTLIRIGNDEYAKENQSYGLTTLRKPHVDIHGAHIHFKFKGKSHVVHDIEIEDAKLAQIIKKCQDLPGYEIFEYIDDGGKRHDVKSDDINAYLKEISGHDFTAKDFRTWAGTLLAAKALQEYKSFSSEKEAKKQIIEAIESVAQKLGNTRAICRKCYVHPQVLEAHMDGTLAKLFETRAASLLKGRLKQLPKAEAALLVLLERSFKA